MKQLKIKCWIEADGEKYYGPGPHELLKQIQKEGSLSKAAEKMHMSYKKAWAMVQRLNQFSEEALVILKKGGQHGGGAEVSPYALEIMKEYDTLQLKVKQLIDQEGKLLKFLK
ncbi:LysR family transcriptional regulator [Subsaximicrobium wynnwilliamsii]|uniref:LysR family transcriptional regulator n=2 Tax=Flavobacteriaceae TaxID=49546 RepID=A0A5C6ZGE6_9FLAO|nr:MULTISPECIES: winged helix-turn-helix domain-containing protein [Flavobacteriaceae]OBX25416.1 ModE family transcriptional regulator [Gelidibacter algens]RAJ24684.1 molybdate transport system regulatory protein [Gelidibacter algens]TXD83164.1 LysR family transcriptional regulator [Subsaximicrobium wynnwilliamsii]TXD88277.1 LysR family transcriptional regulator [Subsaximicrobium wynnwilliamsii]TXE02998.1 LysR family transcriptional regulator [Subsaximicrobium wynnwilliamsii]